MTNPNDLRQSEEYAQYMQKQGWEVGKIKDEREKIKDGSYINCFVKKIPLLGSVIKIQRPQVIPSQEDLDRLAQKHRALFIKIEPAINYPPSPRLRGAGQLPTINYKLQTTNFLDSDSWPLLPSKTLRLDLTKTEEELWENLDPDARYSIRRAAQNLGIMNYEFGIMGEAQLENLEVFYKLLKETGGRKGFYTPKWIDLKNKAICFGKKAHLILSQKEDGAEPVAGCLLLLHDSVAYYHHAANPEEGKRLLAGYLVLWEAIKLAKALGCHTFDFEGIYDERFSKATRTWQGFTYFKKKFGGKEIEFPRPLVRYYSLPIKLLFKFFGS